MIGCQSASNAAQEIHFVVFLCGVSSRPHGVWTMRLIHSAICIIVFHVWDSLGSSWIHRVILLDIRRTTNLLVQEDARNWWGYLGVLYDVDLLVEFRLFFLQKFRQVTLLELSELQQLQLVHLVLLLKQMLLEQQLLSMSGSNLLIQIILTGLPLVFEVVHQKEILTTLQILLKGLPEIVIVLAFLHLSIFLQGIFVPVVAGWLVFGVRPERRFAVLALSEGFFRFSRFIHVSLLSIIPLNRRVYPFSADLEALFSLFRHNLDLACFWAIHEIADCCNVQFLVTFIRVVSRRMIQLLCSLFLVWIELVVTR